jgi:hypothetical protein
VIALGLAACDDASARPASSGAVVVELFTSQGCSSCPPADRLLSTLGPPLRDGGPVILPLAFHVDYWNDLGWADPMSTPAWTERQQRYAAAMRGGRVYTPQLVVQGSAHVVGSRGRSVADAIAAATAVPPVVAHAQRDGDAIVVDADGVTGADVFVAVTEDGIATQILRGENAGASARDDHVVRAFARVVAAGARSGRATIAIDKRWRRDRLAVVVLAQRPDDLVITAASAVAIEAAK